MAFTQDQQLELLSSGQADWDTSLNANFAILERGQHIYMTAGSAVNTGQVCSVLSGALVWPTNARSESNIPRLISYRAVSSGEAAQFQLRGSVRSMSIWSGNLRIGEPVFVSAQSAGMVVSSFAGHGHAVGWALAADAIAFGAGTFPVFPGLVTEVATVGPITTGSFSTFTLNPGNRGIVRNLTVISSHDRFKVRFWSGSARVNSELLYETLTRSWATSSADVTSTYFQDAALFPYRGTDVNTPWSVFGRIDAQANSGVSSAYAVVTFQVERFR